MNRLNMLANLRNIQAKMAEAHFLIIEEIERMGSDGSEEGPMPKPTEDLSEMVEWCQDTEAPSRWRAPGTKDIGQKVRCSLWLGVPPEDMREGILVDIRKGDQDRNEYLVKHHPSKHHRGYQQWWPVAWTRSEKTTADVLHIELVPPPQIFDVAEVVLRDGECFLATEEVADCPAGLGSDWRFLKDVEVFKNGDMITACGPSTGWISASYYAGRTVSEWTQQRGGNPGNFCYAARLRDEDEDGDDEFLRWEYITPGPEHVGQMVEVSDDLASWYPRKLLAVMALGGGFIVHALGEEAGVGMKKLHARVKA
jgi:hypothetical protein